MLETIAIAIMALGFLLLIVSVAILYPMLRRERQADAETIRAARLEPKRTDLEV